MKDKNYKYRKIRLVCGIGINDADYPVGPFINGKQVWCPFYKKWKNLLTRCYDEKRLLKSPSYTDCYVCDDWIYFSKFKAWMETKDWEGKDLDKDILFPGNKEYSPDTCVFIDNRINTFILTEKRRIGDLPSGVEIRKGSKRFHAACSNVDGRKIYLGAYDTPELAHKVWKDFKTEQAKILTDGLTDKRIREALIDRYENYEKYF